MNKKKQRTSKKLALHRETLRNLSDQEVRGAAAAADTDWTVCVEACSPLCGPPDTELEA